MREIQNQQISQLSTFTYIYPWLSHTVINLIMGLAALSPSEHMSHVHICYQPKICMYK